MRRPDKPQWPKVVHYPPPHDGGTFVDGSSIGYPEGEKQDVSLP